MELLHWFSRALSTKTKARILELLAKGADPNIADSAGNTPLHYAAITNFDVQTLRAVVRHGGRCDKGNVLGETPLHFAAYNHGFKATSAIQALIECGANPNRQDRRGNTPLHMVFLELRAKPNAITTPAFNVNSDDPSIVDLLLRHDADPNIKNADGDTPLMSALKQKARPSIIKLLLAHGADPNTRDKHGTPALIRALMAYKDYRGNTGASQSLVVTALLSRGAKPKVRDSDGDSPLHVAAAHGSVWVIKSLIDSGADRCATNKEGHPPVAYARTSRIRGWLDDSGCAPQGLGGVARQGTHLTASGGRHPCDREIKQRNDALGAHQGRWINGVYQEGLYTDDSRHRFEAADKALVRCSKRYHPQDEDERSGR